MRRLPNILICVLLFAAGTAGAQVAGASSMVRVPTLNVKERILPNGLRLLSVEDHSSPTVAIQAWYKVGSKDDPEGRSGFAHLFEHMMFKSTKNMKDEMMDRLTEDVGGYNNASTADDYTHYFEVVPSNYLQTLLWAEAERLSSLNVSETNFKSERDVVKEEFRQRVLAPPYGKLFYLIEQKSFSVHPYRHPGIGSIEDLEAATLQDVRAFHAAFYRPDNVTLVVVGDFVQNDLDTWVDKYFAPIAKPDCTVPRVTAREPARTAEKRFEEYGPNVPLPAVAMTFLVPPAADRQAAALRVAETILSSGESSRLYQALVYRSQVAQEAFATADLREDAGLFVVGAILASGRKVTEAEDALQQEIRKLQEVQIEDAELQRAKNQIVTGELRERESSNGKAHAVGHAAVLLGDPALVNGEIDRLQKVTAADVQEVMRGYFAATNRTVIHYLPEPARKGPGSPGNGRESR